MNRIENALPAASAIALPVSRRESFGAFHGTRSERPRVGKSVKASEIHCDWLFSCDAPATWISTHVPERPPGPPLPQPVCCSPPTHVFTPAPPSTASVPVLP